MAILFFTVVICRGIEENLDDKRIPEWKKAVCLEKKFILLVVGIGFFFVMFQKMYKNY